MGCLVLCLDPGFGPGFIALGFCVLLPFGRPRGIDYTDGGGALLILEFSSASNAAVLS